jgi:hypothetical protein
MGFLWLQADLDGIKGIGQVSAGLSEVGKLNRLSADKTFPV